MIDLTDSFPEGVKIFKKDNLRREPVPENYRCRVKGMLVVSCSSMYLSKWKRVHVTSVSQGFLKVCWKINCYVAINYFVKHYHAGINPSALQWSPTKLTQHICNTIISWEFIFHPSGSSSLCHFNFVNVFFCVGWPNWGSILYFGTN